MQFEVVCGLNRKGLLHETIWLVTVAIGHVVVLRGYAVLLIGFVVLTGL